MALTDEEQKDIENDMDALKTKAEEVVEGVADLKRKLRKEAKDAEETEETAETTE